MRWLNYHHLLYFWTVARTGSIAAASRELYLSPPAISTQIKSLETMFGTALFARTGRGLELTDAGRKAFAYAEQIFRLGSELRHALESDGAQTRLRIGVAPLTPRLLASRLLAPLFAANDARLEVRDAPHDALHALLASREVDVILTDEAPSGNQFDTVHLTRVPFGLFARPGVIDVRGALPAPLHKAPALMPGEGTALRARLSAFFDHQGAIPNVVGESDDGMLLLELARNGAGLVAAPLELRSDLETVHGLELIAPAPGVHTDVLLTTSHALRRHPTVERLLRIREHEEEAPARRAERYSPAAETQSAAPSCDR